MALLAVGMSSGRAVGPALRRGRKVTRVMSLTLAVRVHLDDKSARNLTVVLPTGTPAEALPELVAAHLYAAVGEGWRSAHVTNMGRSNFVLTRLLGAHFTEFPPEATREP